ncbi:MAG: hypothetical protein R3Y28_00685 [Candidatus Gastranaerophilales bacterium]
MNKKLIHLLIMLSLSANIGQSAQVAEQILSTSLGEILELSKVIVDGTEHDRDIPLTGVDKNGTTVVDANLNQIQLTPIQVKIHTNLSTPISVTAEFLELKHIENTYNFDGSDITFSPSTLTISNPYDNIISDEFVPLLNVRSEATTGIYTGQVRFTVSAI